MSEELTGYQPLPVMQMLQYKTFEFPAKTRLPLSKQDREIDDAIEIAKEPKMMVSPTEEAPEKSKPTLTPEQQSLLDEFKSQHPMGAVSVVWVRAFTQPNMNGWVADVWYAPDDKRNAMYVPPSNRSRTNTYLYGTYKAIYVATRPEIFQRGDALVINIDDADIIENHILKSGGPKKNMVQRICEKLWKENGTEVAFVLNGVRTNSRGIMFEQSVIHQSYIMQQQCAMREMNAQLRNRKRATCLDDLFPQNSLHNFMSAEDQGKHFYQKSIGQ